MNTLPTKEEINEIWHVALKHLPEHYILKKVDLVFGGGFSHITENDFEILIEFENHIDENLRGMDADIESYQKWEAVIEKKIREKWPPRNLRIAFVEKPKGST